MTHRVKLTETDRFTIKCALRYRYNQAMDSLNLEGSSAGFWLVVAGESWNAYKAVDGQSLNDGVRS